MSKTKFVYPFLIVFLCVTCGQKKTNPDSQFGSIRDAKGYYNEGDKKFKIFQGGVFRTNETNSFKSLFPLPLITLFQVG